MNSYRFPAGLFSLVFSFVFVSYCSTSYFVTGTFGPYMCADQLNPHITTKLTEVDEDSTTGINFLSYGDKCHWIAQAEFESTMFLKYEEFMKEAEKSNADLFEELDDIWNKWRVHSHSDGHQICNPKRLLTCSPTTNTCGCRQEFQLDGEYTRRAYKDIVLTEEIEEFYSAAVTTCRGKDLSNCGWEAPWLGFCHIECIKGHRCVGTGDKIGSKECVRCDPSTSKGLEECIVTARVAGDNWGEQLSILREG